MYLKAKWEAKTDNKIIKNMARDRMADLKTRKESNLQERRAKLAQLLSSEDTQYEQEFLASLETPEQVRERMAQRLDELKATRKQE